MKFPLITKLFSFSLLIIYTSSIFQESLLNGLHLISHTSEILSEQFTFHQHGSGKIHVHHSHDAMEIIKIVLNQDDRSDGSNTNQKIQPQVQLKFHLPAYSNIVCHEASVSDNSAFSIFDKLVSIFPDILTPPPKV